MFCNKRQMLWFLSLVLLFSLSLALPASAAGRTRRPVEALPVVAEGSAFFYKEVNDFREVVSRFALSNAARSLGMMDKDVASLFDLLRRWPAESMAALFGEAPGSGEESFCFVFSYPETYRSALQKIGNGTAAERDVRPLFFGQRGGDPDDVLSVTREEAFYKVRCGGFRLYCTARDNLLICAFDEDDLARPLAALSSGRHFTPPGRSGKSARNFAIFDAGSLTGDIMSGAFGIDLPEGAKAESLRVETDFAFQPGGWKLDVETNLTALLNLGKGEAKGDAKVAVPAFERLGGGRLLAATSAVLGTDSLYARASRITRSIFPRDNSGPPILRAFLGEEDSRALGMERVDVVSLSYPGLKWPDGVGLYTRVKVSNRARLAELQRETDAFLARNAESDPYTKLESAKWKHLYAMDLRGEGIASSVMLGFADDAFLFGFLPRSGFDEPFSTDRTDFEELVAKPDAFFYADFERTRGSIREMWSRDDDEPYNRRRRAREFYSLMLALTSDITELSAVEKSPGTMTIEAKTARPDIDDRMWIYGLMEDM